MEKNISSWHIKFAHVSGCFAMSKKTKTIAFRVTEPLHKVMSTYLDRNARLNESDLMRTALSDYLKKEIPSLYREIMNLR